MLILVVGSGRCGSTPVAEIIARHPDVGFVSNVDDKLALLDLAGRWNPALFRRPCQPRRAGRAGGRRLLVADGLVGWLPGTVQVVPRAAVRRLSAGVGTF